MSMRHSVRILTLLLFSIIGGRLQNGSQLKFFLIYIQNTTTPIDCYYLISRSHFVTQNINIEKRTVLVISRFFSHPISSQLFSVLVSFLFSCLCFAVSTENIFVLFFLYRWFEKFSIPCHLANSRQSCPSPLR